MAPSSAEVRALFRQWMRMGKTFPNYNIKHYIQRKAREDFRAAATEPSAQEAAWARAKQELEIFKRQSVVYSLYGRKIKNVLELDAAASKAGASS